MSGSLPAKIAAAFTMGEIAVLSIIAAEIGDAARSVQNCPSLKLLALVRMKGLDAIA
jgi:hypothetical protein